ncbi:hypothetical protein D3C85_955710 [compost metagenome]
MYISTRVCNASVGGLVAVVAAIGNVCSASCAARTNALRVSQPLESKGLNDLESECFFKVLSEILVNAPGISNSQKFLIVSKFLINCSSLGLFIMRSSKWILFLISLIVFVVI